LLLHLCVSCTTNTFHTYQSRRARSTQSRGNIAIAPSLPECPAQPTLSTSTRAGEQEAHSLGGTLTLLLHLCVSCTAKASFLVTSSRHMGHGEQTHTRLRERERTLPLSSLSHIACASLNNQHHQSHPNIFSLSMLAAHSCGSLNTVARGRSFSESQYGLCSITYNSPTQMKVVYIRFVPREGEQTNSIGSSIVRAHAKNPSLTTHRLYTESPRKRNNPRLRDFAKREGS